MGNKMGNKRIYILSIFYITIYAIIFKFTYPELVITSLSTVIAVIGFISALITNYLLPRANSNQGNKDE